MSIIEPAEAPGPLTPPPQRNDIRWWPAALILLVTLTVVLVLRSRDSVPFQQRNLQTLGVCMGGILLLLIWWVAFSRAAWKKRLTVTLAFGILMGGGLATFRIRGVTGDLVPILEPRWVHHTPSSLPGIPVEVSGTNAMPTTAQQRPDYPQFLGPNRTAILSRPILNPDWEATPPRILWQQPVGAAWSGFAVVGKFALTQEQRAEDEWVTCYEAETGRLIWAHTDPARYFTTIAGEGPRCTPTAVSNRVYTLGATGILNCLNLESGQLVWQRNITDDAETKVPGWGYSGSPLVFDGRVVVSAGGRPDRSLLAYRCDTGELEWSAGSAPANYGSPFLTELVGIRQILAFNSERITAHEADSGRVLWEYPWGVGHPHVSIPVITATNRVLFSSGYGVGSELLELSPGPDHSLTVNQLWRSRRMKAKFANLLARDGFLYGLDDGMFACIDLEDGSLRWKEGRYGHGQGLLIGELVLLMSEKGELILLRPTPDAPNELQRFQVFDSKTWNPIALAGDLLLVRNDLEAAALRLPVE
jgi:outer membrane protein assembly factor BamB